jgi:hypothetical protein
MLPSSTKKPEHQIILHTKIPPLPFSKLNLVNMLHALLTHPKKKKKTNGLYLEYKFNQLAIEIQANNAHNITVKWKTKK